MVQLVSTPSRVSSYFYIHPWASLPLRHPCSHLSPRRLKRRRALPRLGLVFYGLARAHYRLTPPPRLWPELASDAGTAELSQHRRPHCLLPSASPPPRLLTALNEYFGRTAASALPAQASEAAEVLDLPRSDVVWHLGVDG